MKELADGTPQKRYVLSTIFYVSLQEWERSQQKIKVRENLKYFGTPIFRRVVENLIWSVRFQTWSDQYL
jgi:hypothetical protein